LHVVFLERWYVAGLAIVLVLISLAYALGDTATRRLLVGEDRIVELATIAVLVIAAGVAIRATKAPAGWRHPSQVAPALLVAGLAATAALDELSFGARIFGFTPPVVEGASLDAVHDLVLITGLFILHRDSLIVSGLIVLVLGALAAAAGYWLVRSGLLSQICRLRFGRLLIAALILAQAASLVDLDQITLPAMQLWEEQLELTASVLLLLSATATRGVSLRVRARSYSRPTLDRIALDGLEPAS
jgi:hypothetical protein